MKIASHLWQSPLGVFYFRETQQKMASNPTAASVYKLKTPYKSSSKQHNCLQPPLTIAVMHSMVQTTVAKGLDPYRYLLNVFEIMPSMTTRQEREQLLQWDVILPNRLAPSELVA